MCSGTAVGRGIRITSYNVCYTKLLRPEQFERASKLGHLKVVERERTLGGASLNQFAAFTDEFGLGFIHGRLRLVGNAGTVRAFTFLRKVP